MRKLYFFESVAKAIYGKNRTFDTIFIYNITFTHMVIPKKSGTIYIYNINQVSDSDRFVPNKVTECIDRSWISVGFSYTDYIRETSSYEYRLNPKQFTINYTFEVT